MNKEITLTASVSGGTWSYVTNQNGNSMRVTIEGHGSCTPADVLQEFLDELTPEDKQRWSDDCDKELDTYD